MCTLFDAAVIREEYGGDPGSPWRNSLAFQPSHGGLLRSVYTVVVRYTEVPIVHGSIRCVNFRELRSIFRLLEFHVT